MKKAIEWMRQFKWRYAKEDIETIQKDTWQSATKAQMEKDIAEDFDADYFTPAPFPGDPT